MIVRIPGSAPTRSRAVVHGGIVHAVAVSPDKVPSTYEQTRRALAAIDQALAEAGTDKTRILTATVYIADMAQKPAMNQAWDEWVALADPPLRACLGVALEGQDLVEILVTAALGRTDV
ncbi:MAG TPA: RidA family protein [Beijerinckiaceae bacterium]|jgi:enamine deaminase RidA (YjgF/YER057c/UK114 family)